jgi:hypothetical protein
MTLGGGAGGDANGMHRFPGTDRLARKLLDVQAFILGYV